MTYPLVTSLVKRLYDNRFTRPAKRSFVRSIAAKNGPRTLLNRYYNALSDEGVSRFHTGYAKIFRERGISMSPGEWNVYFAGRLIRLPLRSPWSWLDWDTAVSIIAHDIEIKQTYTALLASDHRPALFFDVGANYGTHSVLFLAVGIPVIAFEPNPTCLEHFHAICKLNGFSARWEQVAIGSEVGEIELVYPERDTWLGSVSSTVQSNLKESAGMTSLRVPIRDLDYFLNDIPRGNVLIKIDVEGHESEVLRGASRVLRDCMPTIIFESNDAKTRSHLFCVLSESGYCVHPLPWQTSERSHVMGAEEFLVSVGTNFLAIPRIASRL
jgi:FkbM family methyltransferase